MTVTTATVSTLGQHVEGFEDALSLLDGVTFEVFEEVDEYGYYTEAVVRVPLSMDDAMDLLHDALEEFSISGEWSEG